MTRLTFNQVSEKFTAMGYTLEKLSKGYKVVAIEDIKFARLEGQDSAIEWLDKQMNLAPAPTENNEATELELYHIVTEQGTLSIWSECESAEIFLNSGVLDSSEGVEYWNNGDVKRFNPDTLYCELPQTLANFEGIELEVMQKTEWFAATPLTCPIQSFQTSTLPRNIVDEMITEAKANDTYWINWNTAYYQALDTLATKKHHVELVQFNAKWNTMIDSKTTSTNHSEVGLIVVLMVVEFLKLAAVLLSFTIVFTYFLMRRTAINHALIYDSFKSAVSVAKRTLQTA